MLSEECKNLSLIIKDVINDEFDSEAASIDMVTLNFLWAEGKFGAMNRDIYDYSYKHKRNELWEVVKDLQVNEWGSTNYCCFLLLQTVIKVFSVVSGLMQHWHVNNISHIIQ